MKFKVDENLPTDVATILREAGHDAHSVRDENLTGASDTQLMSVCLHEQRALITLDLDFSDIRAYPPQTHPGIIVLRPAQFDREQVLSLVRRLLAALAQEPLAQHLWIVDESRIRIRG